MVALQRFSMLGCGMLDSSAVTCIETLVRECDECEQDLKVDQIDPTYSCCYSPAFAQAPPQTNRNKLNIYDPVYTHLCLDTQ